MKVNIFDFVENPDNPQKVSDEDFAALVESIRKSPGTLKAARICFVSDYVALDGSTVPGNCVIAGNKRLRALKQIASEGGLTVDGVECVTAAGEVSADWFFDMTAFDLETRRRWLVKSNVQTGEWDAEALLKLYSEEELGGLLGAGELDDLLGELSDSVASTTGDPSSDANFDFDHPENESTPDDENPEYQDFVDKFKPKKTTDDCYTPKLVYDAVADWVAKEYSLDPSKFVRPFYPGGDYQSFDYSGGKIVVDNPPFSIMSEILKFYDEKKISYFLFGPALTIFSSCSQLQSVHYVITQAQVIYANGAVVSTSFVTSFGGDIKVDVRPDLLDVIDAANKENLKAQKRTLPKLQYPMAVATAARLGWLAVHGERFALKAADIEFVRKLDAQENGNAIFGGGFLLSERAAAERAAAICFTLSERELEIQKRLG
jgi:hypothetical protein